MMSRQVTPDACRDLLCELTVALRDAAPRLNQKLPFPQRTGIVGVIVDEVRIDGHLGCRAVVTVRVAGGIEKNYVLVVKIEGRHAMLAISDEADYADRIRLATQPGKPLHYRDAHALYEALVTDLAGHFGTDS